ncbi:MAG: hypothetical protein HY778_00110 [Betaproteobacteria bacterium]|nr:hypothetical protein [Betaproteobacteria bacterium]
MTFLRFKPLDTLFFRDGRPYNRDESNAQVQSQFPPFSPTLIGAARAAYARSLGWPGKPWGDCARAHLGSGDVLEPLSFTGPYLLRGEVPLFPLPGVLVEDDAGNPIRLAPGPALQSDLGRVRFPQPAAAVSKIRPVAGWINRDDMAKVLAGGLPGRIYADAELFEFERRVGNWRDGPSRTVREDNAVYSPAYVRLASDVELVLEVRGLEAPEPPANPAPVGGESRLCWIVRDDGRLDPPVAPQLAPDGETLRYCAVVVTPLDVEDMGLPHPDKPFGTLPGKVVSAILGRALRAGGWRGTKAGAGEPVALRVMLPPGSVLFMEARSADRDAVMELHGGKVGARQEWGFGQLFVGCW